LHQFGVPPVCFCNRTHDGEPQAAASRFCAGGDEAPEKLLPNAGNHFAFVRYAQAHPAFVAGQASLNQRVLG